MTTTTVPSTRFRVSWCGEITSVQIYGETEQFVYMDARKRRREAKRSGDTGIFNTEREAAQFQLDKMNSRLNSLLRQVEYATASKQRAQERLDACVS